MTGGTKSYRCFCSVRAVSTPSFGRPQTVEHSVMAVVDDAATEKYEAMGRFAATLTTDDEFQLKYCFLNFKDWSERQVKHKKVALGIRRRRRQAEMREYLLI